MIPVAYSRYIEGNGGGHIEILAQLPIICLYYKNSLKMIEDVLNLGQYPPNSMMEFLLVLLRNG